MFFWVLAAAVLAYAFRGTLTVWWLSLRGVEHEHRRLVETATTIQHAVNTMKETNRLMAGIAAHAPLKQAALPSSDDPVAGFLRAEQRLDEAELHLRSMEKELLALGPDPKALADLERAWASLAAERRRLEDAVQAHVAAQGTEVGHETPS